MNMRPPVAAAKASSSERGLALEAGFAPQTQVEHSMCGARCDPSHRASVNSRSPGGRARATIRGEEALSFERFHCLNSEPSALELLDSLNVRQEVFEKVLDSVPQRRGRGGAAGTGALHLQVDDAVAEALEDDVAAVACHRRSDPCLNQFLDRLDGFGVLWVEKLAGRRYVGAARVEQ